jgi:hypothetical protein
MAQGAVQHHEQSPLSSCSLEQDSMFLFQYHVINNRVQFTHGMFTDAVIYMVDSMVKRKQKLSHKNASGFTSVQTYTVLMLQDLGIGLL